MPLDCQIMHGCQVSMSCTCAQAQELAQNYCGNNCEGIFAFIVLYKYMYIYIYIYVYIYIYSYIYKVYIMRILNHFCLQE